jgi:ribonuclease BN (tRNA processing enzyme)
VAGPTGPPPSPLPVVLLGSGGWIPTSRRETCSAIVRRGTRALAIDAGTGISRLVEDPSLLDGVEQLDLVLTHFHLDHVVGLAYLPALELPEPPRLHGPGRWLYDASTEDILGRLFGSPGFALELDQVTASVSEIGPRGASIGPFELHVREQRRHDDPTVAYRLGDEMAYCTDTAYDPETAAFARGTAHLVHEAWCTEAERLSPATHTTARQAAQLAADAAVDELTLIHIRPGQDEAALKADAASAFPAAAVGADVPLSG